MKKQGNSSNSSRTLFQIFIIAFIGVLVYLNLDWVKQNLTLVLTIVAIIILFGAIVRFVIKKHIGLIGKILFTLLIVAACGFLFWVYLFPIILPWLNQNKLAVVILAILIMVGTVILLIFKIRSRELFQPNEGLTESSNERVPISNSLKKEVINRANGRCQWNRCQMRGYNLHIHHIDKNHSNNQFGNLIYLCPNHHQDAHHNVAPAWQLREWVKGNY
jgi:hypothetical protein